MTIAKETIESLSDKQIQDRLNTLVPQTEVQGPIPQDRLGSMSDSGIQYRLNQLTDGNSQQAPLTLDEQNQAYDYSLKDGVGFNTIEDNYQDYSEDVPVIDNPRGKIGFVETLKETSVAEKLPFVGSMFKITKMKPVIDSITVLTSKKVKMGEFDKPTGRRFRDATESELKMHTKFIEDYVIELAERQERGVSIGGRIAQTVTEMPSFIVEFLLTGPIFKTGSAAAKRAATKLLGESAERGISKLAVKAAGAGFGTMARTLVNVPRILEGTATQMTPGVQFTDDGAIAFADVEISPAGALLRSVGRLYVENLTEIAGGKIGEGFSFAGKGIAKKFPVIGKITKELAEKWVSKKAGRTTAEFFSKTNTAIGYNGVLQELGEEELGRILSAAIPGLEKFDNNLDRVKSVIPSWEQLLVETGAISILGGVNLAGTKMFRGDITAVQPVKDISKLSQEEFDVEISKFTDMTIKDKSPETIKFINNSVNTKAESDIKVVNVATKTRALAGKIVESSTNKLTEMNAFLALGVARAEDALGFMGKTGLKVQKDFRDIAFRTAVNVGNTSQNIKQYSRGITQEEKAIVAQLIDGAIMETGQPERLVIRANKIKEQLDIIQENAIEVGLRKGGLTGKAFPQVLNKDGKELIEVGERDMAKSSKVFAWAQLQINDGKFESIEDAIVALVEYRKQLLSGKQGYLEGTRTLNIGNEYREWNLDSILSGTIESSWEKIEANRQWGTTKDGDFKQIKIDIEKIRLDTNNDSANAISTYIDAQYGKSKANSTLAKWSRGARIVQFVEKLAFSPLTITRNMLDRYAKGLSHGTVSANVRATIQYPPFLNNWIKSAKEIEDQMIRRGAVLGHGHLAEGVRTTEGIIPLVAKPFASSEKGNQTYIALVKKIQLESDIKSLMEMDGRDGVMSKVFDRMTTIVGSSQSQTKARVLTNLTNEQLVDSMASGGHMQDDVLAEVLHRTVTDSAFPLTLASKRLWWGSMPVVQTVTQFKVWSADQMRFIYKDVLKYGVQTGDYSRLGRFILASWLAGEMYNIARDSISNKDESVLSKLKGGTRQEIIESIGSDLTDGGAVGFLADFTYGIGDWSAGPTVNTIAGTVDLATNAWGTATFPEATAEFLMNDVPALRQAQGVIDNLDSIFEENNLTEDYARWQGRSFKFRKDKGDKVASNMLFRSLRGTPKQKITERSLSLDMVSRQVLVGDYDDAAQHIKRVIRDTKVEDVKGAIQAFRSSMRSNSPFGNIANRDLGLFIAQFGKEEGLKGIKLQQQWLTGYTTALKIAFDELKQEGFVDELKIKAEKYKEEMSIEIDTAKPILKGIQDSIKGNK